MSLLVTVFGVLWFDIPFVGNPLVMLLGASLFLLAALGLRADAVDLFAHPAAGVCLDLLYDEPAVSSFPASRIRSPRCRLALRWFTLINPLRYFLVVIRSVFLKGVGLDVLWQPMTAMALLGLGMLSIERVTFPQIDGLNGCRPRG